MPNQSVKAMMSAILSVQLINSAWTKTITNLNTYNT